MNRLKMTEEELEAERNKARQGVIRQAAQGLLQRWVEGTPDADVAFVEATTERALSVAAALIDAKAAMGKE